MDQVQIKVFKTQLLQSLIQRFLDKLWLVRVVPQLVGDEHIFTLHDAGEDFLECSANFIVVAVDFGQVQVTVAGLDGVLYGSTNFAGLRQPRTKTNLRDLVAVVEGEGLCTVSLTRSSLQSIPCFET